MVLKNVKAEWIFISRADTNDNYRITFAVSKEQDEELVNEMSRIAAENGKKSENADWFGSRKEDEETGAITYTAKCSREFTNKKGETIIRELPVYDKHAIELKGENIPNPANGAIVNVEVQPYFSQYMKKWGIALNFRSIQLIAYEEYNGGNPYEDEEPETNASPFSNESTQANKSSIFA